MGDYFMKRSSCVLKIWVSRRLPSTLFNHSNLVKLHRINTSPEMISSFAFAILLSQVCRYGSPSCLGPPTDVGHYFGVSICWFLSAPTWCGQSCFEMFPDSKAHGANMEPTWVLSAPDGPHVGPMNLAIRVITVLSLPQMVPWWCALNMLKQECYFDAISITGCIGSCHFDNFRCSQWWKFHQNDKISVPVRVSLLTHNCRWSQQAFGRR